MKIITWNINSVRLRLPLLKRLQKEENPDIIGLQETKCMNDKFPLEEIQSLGYKHVVFSGQKSYNGVAILSKLPIKSSFSIELYNEDKRHIAAQIGDVEMHNFYVPAGGDEPDTESNPKYKHKLEYVRLMEEWFRENRSKQQKIVLMGDLNIAPFEHDVWSSRQLRNVISHTPPEREAMNSLRESFGFIDTGRYNTPLEEKLYTWWSYRNRDWEKSNRGRRLDHIWTSDSLKDRLGAIRVIRGARNWDSPSDHVPFSLELK